MLNSIKKELSASILFLLSLPVYAQWSITPEVGGNVTKYNNAPAKMGVTLGSAVAYTFAGRRFSLQSGIYFTQRKTGKMISITGWYPMDSGNGNIPPSDNDYYNNFFPILGNGGFGSNFNIIGGALTSIDKTESVISINQLKIPVMARFNWDISRDGKIHIAFGSYAAWGIKGKYNTEQLKINVGKAPEYQSYDLDLFKKRTYTREFTPFDWGLSCNAGFEIGLFTLDFTYDVSFKWPTSYYNYGTMVHGGFFTPTYNAFCITAGYKFQLSK